MQNSRVLMGHPKSRKSYRVQRLRVVNQPEGLVVAVNSGDGLQGKRVSLVIGQEDLPEFVAQISRAWQERAAAGGQQG